MKSKPDESKDIPKGINGLKICYQNITSLVYNQKGSVLDNYQSF
jgi:hypothetical protein